MKKIIVILVAFVFRNFLYAQTGNTDIKAGWGTLDYSVPESPASKILGSSPDNLLKPTSVRNIALNIGNYFLTTGSIIPKNLAVEISPLLLNGKASLNSYNKNKFLYRLRLSLGTNVLDNGGYSVAEGLRVTILDRTDLRDAKSNPGFYNFLYASAIDKSVAVNKAIVEYIQTHPAEHLLMPVALDKYSSDPAFTSLIDNLSKKYYDKLINIDKVSAYRDSVRNLLWNAPIWELGIASLQSSGDSLIKNLKFSQIGFWSTSGVPLGRKGQLLIGAKLSFIDSVQWQTNISIGQRLFYGSNDIKGFLQAQYDYKNKKNGFTASLGCQFNIANGLWGEFSLNLVVDGNGKLSYQPGFNIGFGTPEKKKS
jgi:hypothetical protein